MQKPSPHDRCIVTDTACHAGNGLRFVSDPEGHLYPDLAGKLPGRAYWVRADKNTLQQAVDEGIFSSALNKASVFPKDMVAFVEQQLTQRIIQMIALARKAGQVIGGYEKVRNWLLNYEIDVLFTAHDASQNAISKIKGLRPEEGFCTKILSKTELGVAFGREVVIHAAMLPGELAKRVRDDAMRLQGFRKSVR